MEAEVSDDVLKTVELLNAFLASNLDIPIASVDEEGAPSLFIYQKNVYCDLTVENQIADYYIRVNTPAGPIQVHGEAPIVGWSLPPQLYARLLEAVNGK